MQILYKSEVNVREVDKVLSFFKENLGVIFESIKSENLSLDDRWSIYQKIREYLPIRSYYYDLPPMQKAGFDSSWYDDFYLERMETLKFDQDFVDSVMEKYPGTNIDDLKLSIISSGIGGFIYDW